MLKLNVYLKINPLIFTFLYHRMMTQNEYIIPRDDKTKNLCLYRKPSPDSTTFKIKYAIPKMEESVSIRPCLYVTEKQIEDR